MSLSKILPQARYRCLPIVLRSSSTISSVPILQLFPKDVRPLGEKVKEATKTASYTGVILVGVGVTALIFYYVFRELFSGNSANSIYSAALARCIEDTRVQDSLGTPIKGFGEESSRRRRSHVSHVLYEKNGVNCIRMKFYLKGTRNQGTVNLDMMQNSSGQYEYRYLFVQLDDYNHRVIIIEDNRSQLDRMNTSLPAFPIMS